MDSPPAEGLSLMCDLTAALAEGRLQIRGKSEDLFVLSKRGGTFKERDQPCAVMEWVGPVRQMCVSVTDVFWVSRLRWVTDTWRTNISPSMKCLGILMLCLFRSLSKWRAEPKVAFCDSTFGEDLGEDNDVVITCAKLELWLLNEV